MLHGVATQVAFAPTHCIVPGALKPDWHAASTTVPFVQGVGAMSSILPLQSSSLPSHCSGFGNTVCSHTGPVTGSHAAMVPVPHGPARSGSGHDLLTPAPQDTEHVPSTHLVPVQQSLSTEQTLPALPQAWQVPPLHTSWLEQPSAGAAHPRVGFASAVPPRSGAARASRLLAGGLAHVLAGARCARMGGTSAPRCSARCPARHRE